MTIADAARQILKESPESMLPKKIYQEIMKRGIYEFRAKDPIAVVTSTLRKKSDALENNSRCLFHYHENGSYSLK